MARRSASVILDKAAAVLKKDALTALRYRNGFVLGGLGTAAQLATFYYLSRAVGPQFHPEGMPYFLFLLVGTGFFTFLITGMHSFLRTIQESQQSGTLEVLMTTSTPPAVLLSLSAISAFAGGLVQLLLYVGAGMLLFSPAVHVSLLGCVSVCALSVVISIAIGIFAAGLQISIHKGSPGALAAGVERVAAGGHAVSHYCSAGSSAHAVRLAALDPLSDGDAAGSAADIEFSGTAAGNRNPCGLLRASLASQPNLLFLDGPPCPTVRNALFLLKLPRYFGFPAASIPAQSAAGLRIEFLRA